MNSRVIEVGGGHEDLVRHMLAAYQWKPHLYRIAKHGVKQQDSDLMVCGAIGFSQSRNESLAETL